MKIKEGKFLITGGAGLMGSYLAERLLSAQASRIIIVDNFVRGRMNNIAEVMKDSRVKLVKGDIRDATLIMDLLESLDGVFHMAALRITACAENVQECHDVMLTGTYNVLQGMVKKKVKKLVYASSASVYGLADDFPTSEIHHPYNNRTYYGAAKVAGEAMARSFADMYGLQYVALRYFNVYGPRMDIHGKYTEVLIRWLDKLDAGENPIIYGNGSHTMDLIYIDDVIEANIKAMESDVTDEVFNIANGCEISLLKLLQTLIEITGADVKPVFLPERSVNPVPRRLADTSKASYHLGFNAKVKLHDGLKRLIEWRKKELVRDEL